MDCLEIEKDPLKAYKYTADYYVDIDTTKKNVELKGKTKGGVMDWKIKDNVDPKDIVNRGKVRKC